MVVEGRPTWEQFATAIGEAADVPVEMVGPGTRLLEDLGLDSLALSEVVVLLVVEFEMTSVESGLGTREWERVTVGELFEEYQSGERPARPAEFMIRKRPAR